MRITDSNVTMASNRSYRQGGTSNRGTGGFGSLVEGIREKSTANLSWGDILNLSSGQNDAVASGNYGRNGTMGANGFAVNGLANGDASNNGMAAMRGSMVNLILSRMQQASGSYGGGGFTESFYYEEESTSFSAGGLVRTEDGREIDFGMQITMSRSFMEYTRVQAPALSGAFMDPLVINTSSPITSLSDQKFYFDLDCDGEEDYISMPKKGSGFLALDANEDGVINDGRELFGALSGDGFSDLSKLDSDGNGWIDENDDIYSKLKVWYKDENGNDVLMNLKEADVGAIYLGSRDTEFSLMGNTFNTDGQIRRTGFYLHEDGSMGTIQHVDLNTAKPEEMILDETDKNLSRLGTSYEYGQIRSTYIELNSWASENGNITRNDSVTTDEKEKSALEEVSEYQKKKNEMRDEIMAQEEARRARRKEMAKDYEDRLHKHKEEQKQLTEDYLEKRRKETEALYEDAEADSLEGSNNESFEDVLESEEVKEEAA